MPALDFALLDLGPSSKAELAAFPGPPLVRVTLVFMRAIVDPRCDPLEALDLLQGELRELMALPGGKARFKVVVRYTVRARPELDVRRVADEFRRVAGEEASEVVMSTAHELIETGRVQERRELLEMQLTEKFGKLTPSTRERLEAASAEDLKTWIKQFAKAKRIEDVFRDRPGSGRSRKK